MPEPILRRRTRAERLRYCADQLAITNGLDADDRTRLTAVRILVEELADELDQEADHG